MIKPLKRILKTALRAAKGPRISRTQLVSDFRRLGIQSGDTLLVHASLSAIGFVHGREKTVITALLEALGPQGTLVLPTHTWEWVNAGSRTYDARSTPSCVGKMPDVFRVMPGVLRSLHPTHSVAALGPQGAFLVEGHEEAQTPCGEGTPYAKLLRLGGRILMLGVGLESNTCCHTLEALTGIPYLMEPQPFEFELRDLNGAASKRMVALHLEGIERCYPDLLEPLTEQKVIQKGKVGAADSLLIEGGAFLKTLTDLLTQNPLLLMARPEQNIPSPRTR